MEKIKWAKNEMPKSDDRVLPLMGVEEIKKATKFHKSFPQYTETPLVKLPKMAEYLGIKEVFIKDESYRFGLNAFKVLGGSYAIANFIADETGKDIEDISYDVLISEELKREFGQATFFTATDGNHGRGVAWAANKLGQKCVVCMPKGSTLIRKNAILAENAECTIEELNYDDCVRKAAAAAERTERGVMVQDTAWEGYEKIPNWIMQGYGTMASEAAEQFVAQSGGAPTHVIVQAGVGSLAGAVVGYFANAFKENPPIFVVVEAQAADCLYRGALKKDGSMEIVGGDIQTIMAGLACGEPNTESWDILRNHCDVFVSAPDWVAARGMRTAAAPIKGDPAVTSGESGAAPYGLLGAAICKEEYKELKEAMQIDENSKVLCFSTEGDTDPIVYKNIVWEGLDK